MTQKLSKNRLGRRNAHNADRIWTVSGCGKAFAKYTFLHVGLATKSIVSFTCQAGMIGEFLENFGGGGLQRARRLGRKSLFSALNSSRALAALAQNFQLTRQLNLLAAYCDDVCGFCVGWLITVMFTL